MEKINNPSSWIGLNEIYENNNTFRKKLVGQLNFEIVAECKIKTDRNRTTGRLF